MGNLSFNENTRVQVPAALHLCKLGYTYLDDICAYDTKTNILIDYKTTLTQQFMESHRLEDEIMKQLESLRFDSHVGKE